MGGIKAGELLFRGKCFPGGRGVHRRGEPPTNPPPHSGNVKTIFSIRIVSVAAAEGSRDVDEPLRPDPNADRLVRKGGELPTAPAAPQPNPSTPRRPQDALRALVLPGVQHDR